MTAAKLIERHKPDVVWNFGTGGITVDKDSIESPVRATRHEVWYICRDPRPIRTVSSLVRVMSNVQCRRQIPSLTQTRDPRRPQDMVPTQSLTERGFVVGTNTPVISRWRRIREPSKTVANGEPYFIRNYSTYR